MPGHRDPDSEMNQDPRQQPVGFEDPKLMFERGLQAFENGDRTAARHWFTACW